jgi:hypothetical protein
MSSGDVLDTTVCVNCRPAAGYLLLTVHEGWSRTSPASSTFTSNLNSITVAGKPAAAAPTVSSGDWDWAWTG